MLNGIREHHGPSIAMPASYHDRKPRLQSVVNGGVELRIHIYILSIGCVLE